MMSEQYKPGDDRGKRLARVLSVALEPERNWSEAELKAVFLHQMNEPVVADLSSFSERRVAEVRLLADSHKLLLKSFGDLLKHPAPPLELLKLTKEFAKANRHAADGVLPPDIAGVLYYAAISAAFLRCGQMISDLGPEQLKAGLAWAAQRTWIDQSTRELFLQAQSTLTKPPA